MAESTKKAPQERRRSLAVEPFEQLDADAKGQGETLKKAALAAAVTAGAGALAGAAKGHESPRTPDAAETQGEESEAGHADEPEAAAPGPAAAEELDDEDAEEIDEENGDELDEDDGRDDFDDPAQAGTDASEIASQACQELERLLGRAPEAVSGIERRNGHWSVMLDVVELRRIPDSTDVLASYELVLDDAGNVARMARKARYLRSQAERQR
jgi:hypothetical protein